MDVYIGTVAHIPLGKSGSIPAAGGTGGGRGGGCPQVGSLTRKYHIQASIYYCIIRYSNTRIYCPQGDNVGDLPSGGFML